MSTMIYIYPEFSFVQELLLREVGEDAMEVLMAGGQHLGWKGRAEQISSLQVKVISLNRGSRIDKYK